MHNYVIPDAIKERIIRRRGSLSSHETIDAGRAALVVVDMQNHFVAEGFPLAIPLARDIVPAINRLATAMRAAGGRVASIQTTATGALDHWGNHHRHTLGPERAAMRLASLDKSAEGFRLYPALETQPGDLRVKKIKYSAFIAGSSNIEAQLGPAVNTLLIAGTATNVCCESTARDAMMLDYRVIMLSDANAASTDEEHAATLNNFMLYFGDVMTTEEAVAKLAAAPARMTA